MSKRNNMKIDLSQRWCYDFHMNYLERRKTILDILDQEGDINTNDLTKRLSCTGATVRSDLRALAREGAIVRYHGGIRKPEVSEGIESDANFMVRSITQVDKKNKIGKAAATLVGSGDTIFMDASSTAFHMIKYLKDTENVTVITNGIHTAMELQHHSNFKSIILLGGKLRPHSGTIESVMSREMIQRLSAEYYFVSGNGFSFENGLSGNNFFELELKRMCAEKSKHVVALVDSTKVGVDSSAVFISPSKIDYLIVDDDVDYDHATKESKERNINLIIAN